MKSFHFRRLQKRWVFFPIQILIFRMLRNNADVRRCSYFELGLPVVLIISEESLQKEILEYTKSVKTVPSCRRKFHWCQLRLKKSAARMCMCVCFFSFCFLCLAENCYICFHHCTTRIIKITNEIHQHKPEVFTYNYFNL